MKKKNETGFNLRLFEELRVALKKTAAEKDISMQRLIIAILTKSVLK